MPYYSSETIEKAREMDLLTYLNLYEPTELVPITKDTYTTKNHDSLKISNGKWYWWTKGVGGRSALDYLVIVKGMSFIEAVGLLSSGTYLSSVYGLDNKNSYPSGHGKKKEKQQKPFSPPAPSCNNNSAIKYLVGRGISRNIIENQIKEGKIYESFYSDSNGRKYKNIAFLGVDEKNNARYASIRGLYGNFKGEHPGSDKRYSFSVSGNDKSENLHLFESAIDLLSYLTLKEKTNCLCSNSSYLSLAGIYLPKKEKGLKPLALEHYFLNHSSIKTLVLHLDNDSIGRNSAVAIINSYSKEGYHCIDEYPKVGKDLNEYLMHYIAKTHANKNNKEKER